MKKNIITLYKEIQNSYENIVDVSDDFLNKIQIQAESDTKEKNTNEYLLIISSATLVFFIFPFIITNVVTNQSLYQTQI